METEGAAEAEGVVEPEGAVEAESGVEVEGEIGGIWFAEVVDEASGRTSRSLLSCILKAAES